jgi:proteasome beta subunit
MDENIKNSVKKGTTTVGVVCKDGIILAADKRASAGSFVANRDVDKVHKVNDDIAITMAGLVSDAQLILKLTKAELRLKLIRNAKKPSMKESANLIANIFYQNVRKPSMVPGIVAFLVGGRDTHGYHLYDVGIDGALMPIKDFTSTGSGSMMAYGVMETLYKEGMSVDEGILLAKKAINSAIQRDVATGDGIDIFTITDKGVKKVETQHLKKEVQ